MRNFLAAPSGMQLLIGAGTAIAAAGAASIAMAPIVTRRQRAARGAGLAYGELEASENAYSPYMDTKQAISGALAAQDPTSQQFIAMMQLGLKPSGNAANDVNRQNIALKELINKFGSFSQFLATLHGTPLGSMISDERARSVRDMPMARLQELAKQEEADAKTNKLTDETTEIYVKLNADLSRFGTTLETVAATQLVGFAGAIDSVVRWLNLLTGTPQPKLEMPDQTWGQWANPKNWFEGDAQPHFATGAYNIGDDGTAMLHQGELVMPAKEASAFRSMLSAGSSEGSKDFGEFNKQLMASSDIIIDLNKSMQAFNDEINSARYLSGRFGGGVNGAPGSSTPYSEYGGGVVGGGGGGSGGGGSGPHSPKSSSGGGVGKGGAPGVDYNATTLPFSKDEYKALTQGVADLESGGKYDISGGAGGHYHGRYQMGQTEIRESATELGLSPPSIEEFRKNPELQEKLYERYTLDHYNKMMKDPAFAAASHEKQLEALGAAQLGTTAGLKWLHGGSSADAWGTPTSSWANSVGKRLSQIPAGGGGGDIGASDIAKITGYGAELGKMKGLRAENPKDREKINAYMKEAGIKEPYTAESIAWCAAWLNAQLAHEGVKGSGGLGVDSFRKWGKAEAAADAKAGDVMIAKGGSHVGRFEGWDKKTGMAKFYAGNEATPDQKSRPVNTIPGYPRSQWGKVGEREVDPSQFEFRGLNKEDVMAAKSLEPKSNRPQHPSSAASASRSDPYGKTPHIGDMSQYHADASPNVTIFNKSGSNYNLQTASLGAAQGNFDA
jgi:hypothetical protein